MSNLLQEIEAQIRASKPATPRQNVGIVREIGDGVAKIEGLTDAMLNEMLDFGNGVIGLALNLEETEVGAIILGDYTEHQGRPGSPHHRQAAAGARRQRPARPRGQRARPAARRQGPDQERNAFIRSKKSPPASSSANPSASRCRPASWRSTR